MISKLRRYPYIGNGMISADVRLLENESVPTHFHEFFEIEYIIAGNGDCIIDGKKYTIRPGMMFFLSPVNTHAVYSSTAQLVNISFSENMCSPSLLSQLTLAQDSIAVYFQGGDRAYFEEAALELSRSLSDSTYSSMLLDCIITKLCRMVNPRHLRRGISTSKKAILYIINNFRKSLTLTETADYVGLTPTYFSMLFKKEMGVSFKEYLDRLRFENAKKLLLLTDMTVQEVCLESGFSCYENFIRRFRRQYGISPTEFKKQAAYTAEELPY